VPIVQNQNARKTARQRTNRKARKNAGKSGSNEDWEPLSTDPDPKPTKSSTNYQNENPRKKPQRNPRKTLSSNPSRRQANHLQYEEELNDTIRSDEHADTRSPLLDLTLSASNDDEKLPKANRAL
jgi:hypothetical protein